MKISTEALEYPIDFIIDKISGDNQNSTSISIEARNENNEVARILFAGSFNGLKTMESVQETYQVTMQISESQNITYMINNNVNFAESIDIEGFTEDNSITLNDFEEEQVTNFLEAVTQRITEVNKQQMEELGLEENQNPLLNIFSMHNLVAYNTTLDEDSTKVLETNLYNNEYLMYESTNSRGVTTKGLMTIISENNEKTDTK